MAVVELVIGGSGTGKSYVMGPVALWDYWLPSTERTIYTNIPFDLEAIRKECVKHPEWAGRIVILDEETLRSWADYVSGPWEYFADKQNWHLIVDECQNYFSPHAVNPIYQDVHAVQMEKLNRWLGEHLRKNNGSAQFMTQNEGMVCHPILHHATVRHLMVPAEETSYLGFRLADISGVWSKWRGKKQGVVAELVQQRKAAGKGNTAWETVRKNIHWLSEWNWRYYKSFNKPGSSSEGSGVKPDKLEWQVLTWPQYLRTLGIRYGLMVGKWVAVAFFLVWFAYGITGMLLGFASGGKKKPTNPTLADPQKEEERIKENLAPVEAARLDWPKPARAAVEGLEKRLTAARSELAAEAVAHAETKRTLAQLFLKLQEQSMIVGVFADGCVLKDGRRLRVGEPISGGLFDGRIIQGIDGDVVVFDGGLRVRPKTGGGMEWTLPAATASALGASGPEPARSGDGTTIGQGLGGSGVQPDKRSYIGGGTAPGYTGNLLQFERGDGRGVSAVDGTGTRNSSSGRNSVRPAGSDRPVSGNPVRGSLRPEPQTGSIPSANRGKSVSNRTAEREGSGDPDPQPTLAD